MNRLLASALLFFVTPAAFTAQQADPAIVEQAVNAPERSAEDRARDASDKPVEVLTFFGVRPGMHVADIMSGGGYYAEILSRIVGPTGEVIAQNNQPYLRYAGKEADKRFADGALKNVHRLNSELESMGLGKNTLDIVLFVMSFHDAYWVGEDWPKVDTDKFMKQLVAAVKPGGIVAVVDHVAAPGTPISAIDELHRIDPEFVKAEFKRYGFMFDGESDVLRNPADDHTKLIFDQSVRHKTDRIVFRFKKPQK